MDGLVNRAQPAPQAPQQPQPEPETSATMPQPEPEVTEEVAGLEERVKMMEEGEDNLDPKEREAYEAAIKMAAEVLYKSDKGSNSVLSQIQASDPVNGVSDVTMFLLDQVEAQFNGQLPETLVLPVVDEISDMVMEMVDESGLAKIDDAMAKQMKQMVVADCFDAYGATGEDYQMVMDGVSPEDVEAAVSEFGGV